MNPGTEAMDDGLTVSARLPWHWELVPGAEGGAEPRAEWTERVAALFEDWTREGLAAARAVWPADAGAEFPFTSAMVGRAITAWLLERADQLPPWSRLAWGAAFVAGRPRWAPVPVVVEFCAPVAEDPDYLMEAVGARGAEGDAREPTVDYVTTPIGDGLRVFALCRGEDGAAYARVHAAMRVDVPAAAGGLGGSADVLLSTFVLELGLMAVIGAGVEQLMQQIAEDCMPGPDGRPVRLGFAAPVGGY